MSAMSARISGDLQFFVADTSYQQLLLSYEFKSVIFITSFEIFWSRLPATISSGRRALTNQTLKNIHQRRGGVGRELREHLGPGDRLIVLVPFLARHGRNCAKTANHLRRSHFHAVHVCAVPDQSHRGGDGL